ncbi:polysaccharide biosynthesis tyrosine autokinase [Kineosporia sp. NBRC 101731]|uniref:polysaccharide biosynthesis tyrosine autokinase n=1 Tax=Kineosporia sp. NBRC 101731 TaxID=3032199 RepID=UPI002552BEF1|nr:polysaccharide biosynthesis tyrosine autokinase [Kineosporia sp. NBRC 101731]
MTLTQYLRVLRQHWLIVLIMAVLGVAAATAYTSRQTPIYQAQTQVFVSAQNPGKNSSLSSLSESSTFSQQRVKSYASMVTSSAVTEPVVKQLRLPYTPGELAGKIDASPKLDTVLIDISVSDPDPDRAAAIGRAVTTQLQDVVRDLEMAGKPTAEPSVMLTVTRPPVAPTAPVSPRVPLNIALGLLLGLGLGIGAAVLRDQLNTTVRGSSDLEQLTGSVPLGVVPFDASAPKHPLVTADAFGGRAEAFRTLRTNLQFADVDSPPRVIAITSALPDEGKTTTACNIALILAQSGARVVLVEGDLRKPAVGKYLGISNGAGLTNVLAGQHDLRDVVVGYERDLLAVLPSGPTPPNPSELLGSQQMRHLLDTLAEHYDVVIIDAPPLLPVTDAALISTAADGAILVVRHGRSRREETVRALKSLESVSAKMLGTVLNFAPRGKGNGYDGYGYGYGQTPAASTVVTRAAEEKAEKRGRRGRKKATEITLPVSPLPLEPFENEGPRLLEPLDLSQAEASDQAGRVGQVGQVGQNPWPETGHQKRPAARGGTGGPAGGPMPGHGISDSGAPGGTSSRGTQVATGMSGGVGPVAGSRSAGSGYATGSAGPAATLSPGTSSSPGDSFAPTGSGSPAGRRVPEDRPAEVPPPSWATADMGWAPSPSDGWAPIADSSASHPPEGPATGSISVFGGLSSTGPLPIVTTPRSDSLTVISRADGVEVSRTVRDAPPDTPRRVDGLEVNRLTVEHHPATEVPQELRLHPLPPDPGPQNTSGPAPETSPSGLRMGTPLSGIPTQGSRPETPDEETGSEHPVEPPGPPPAYTRAWFDGPERPTTPSARPTGDPRANHNLPPDQKLQDAPNHQTGRNPQSAPDSRATWDNRAAHHPPSVHRPASRNLSERPDDAAWAEPSNGYGYLRAGGYIQDTPSGYEHLDGRHHVPGVSDPGGVTRASFMGEPTPPVGDPQDHQQPEADLFQEIPPLTVDLSAPDLDLLEDERELLIPPQSVMPHLPTGVPRHHRSRRSI